MIIDNEKLKEIYFGAYEFGQTSDGYLQAFQFNKAQIEYFNNGEEYWRDRCTASSAKTIELLTDASEFSFEYKIIWQGSLDSFEIFADNKFVQAYRVENLPGEGKLTFSIPEDSGLKRHIIIYLPMDATVLIRNFECNSSYEIPVKGEKVLWLGDSITQGFGPMRSSGTYVNVANRELNYDILNQGIAGYYFDKGSIIPMDGYTPDRIIVAHGTNQYDTKTMKPVEEFFETLFEVYGMKIPTLVITPVWRDDFLYDSDREKFLNFCNSVKEICHRYPNITTVDGFDMVPNSRRYYVDGLHPNEEGASLYGRNLVKFFHKLYTF